MTAHMIAVDAAALDALRADLAEVKRLLIGATVTPAPEWVSISQAAALKECSASTIRRMIDAGEIEANGKTGKARKVRM